MQTTKGIWMARNPEGSILVFDIEGTDSKERGEQRMTFEQTTSLFALAIADVLLINMWTTDIGRYGASNYGLLKVIFEVNLKLFGQSSAKKLLFVLRDFDDRGNNFERIRQIIDSDISNIWNEIFKPEEYRNSKPSDFFDFEFCMLPHKIFEEEKFYQKCKDLRDRLDTRAPNTLFPKTEDGKNVPMDGLSLFMSNTWEKIRTQKELNLPDQRIMVASLRCNELKDEAITLVDSAGNKLREECERKVIDGFSERCTKILKDALSHYDEYAHQYDKTVYNKIKKELAATLINQYLYKCFESQVKLVRKQTFDEFEKEVIRRPSSSKDQVNEDFAKITERGYNDAISRFHKHAADLIVDGTNWGEQVLAHEAELSQQLRSLINNAREKELDKLQMLTQQAAKDNLEQIINKPIYELHPDFWEQMRAPYLKELEMLALNCKDVLKQGFKCTEFEISEFVGVLETTLHQYTADYIKRLFRDINTNLLRKFNKDFKKDEQGKNREWRQIEEPVIRELWAKIRAQLLETLQDFKYIHLPKAIMTETIINTSSINEEEEFLNVSSKQTASLKKSLSLSSKYSRLLTEEDLNRVRDKFQEDIDFVLEEAIRKHHNFQSTSIPWWIYLVLVFFAADNVLSWLTSPFIFYPLIIVLGFVSILYSMGLGGVMLVVIRQSANLILRRVGIDFLL